MRRVDPQVSKRTGVSRNDKNAAWFSESGVDSVFWLGGSHMAEESAGRQESS